MLKEYIRPDFTSLTKKYSSCIKDEYRPMLKEFQDDLERVLIGEEEPDSLIVRGLIQKYQNINSDIQNTQLNSILFNYALEASAMIADYREESKTEKVLLKPISDLDLSVRAANCLRSMNIRTLGEITGKAELEFKKVRGMGKVTINEIKEKLKQYNLSLKS